MQKPITIRPEKPADFPAIHHLIQHAFASAEHSVQQEQFLVERLRHDTAFLPSLALIAQNQQGDIIGHIAFSEALIDGIKVLALAPLSVLPSYQKQGVGSQLMVDAQEIINRLNYPAVVVLGHPKYYTKFGYEPAEDFGITAPFDVPSGVLRVRALHQAVPKGEIQYAKAFFE